MNIPIRVFSFFGVNMATHGVCQGSLTQIYRKSLIPRTREGELPSQNLQLQIVKDDIPEGHTFFAFIRTMLKHSTLEDLAALLVQKQLTFDAHSSQAVLDLTQSFFKACKGSDFSPYCEESNYTRFETVCKSNSKSGRKIKSTTVEPAVLVKLEPLRFEVVSESNASKSVSAVTRFITGSELIPDHQDISIDLQFFLIPSENLKLLQKQGLIDSEFQIKENLLLPESNQLYGALEKITDLVKQWQKPYQEIRSEMHSKIRHEKKHSKNKKDQLSYLDSLPQIARFELASRFIGSIHDEAKEQRLRYAIRLSHRDLNVLKMTFSSPFNQASLDKFDPSCEYRFRNLTLKTFTEDEVIPKAEN